MKNETIDLGLTGYDDLFLTSEERADSKKPKVEEISLSMLTPFKGHPFQVKHDEEIRVNPATGQRTLYPPKVEMSFQPSTILKNKLNNKPPIVS